MTPAESDKNVDESINVYNFRTIGCHRVTSFVLTFHIFPRIAPPPPHISVVYPFSSRHIGSDNRVESSTTDRDFGMVSFRMTAKEVNVTTAETGRQHSFYPILP